ncbi:hypothetical protein HAHE_18210 [Haloferula helveola]|uniref:Ice-binding protein C-terminal domain-containing protein n=1 Tax=Haloferula helveola TaxID=490095 RepID=A0ABN6H2X7_9BACT|nr:hypothetical protein HAHE_18210 [Haloferula helveola]
MNHQLLLRLACATAIVASSDAATLFYADDFSGSDGSFNGASAPEVNTLGGSYALESFGEQQQLSGNSALLVRDPGGIAAGLRFGAAGDRYNWGTGSTAATILADGTLRISFDYATSNATDNNSWIAFGFGTANSDPASSDSRTYNRDEAEYGLRIEGDRVISFVNGGTDLSNVSYSSIGNNTFVPVTIDFGFTSFASGSTVTSVVSINGTEYLNESFTLDSTDDFRWEIGSSPFAGGDSFMDNLSIGTVPEPGTFAVLLVGAGATVLRRRRQR